LFLIAPLILGGKGPVVIRKIQGCFIYETLLGFPSGGRMTKPSLLILSLGELGTAMLEAAARSGIFETLIVASRDKAKALARANNALIGASLEGYFPDIHAENLDFNAPDFPIKLRQIAPDYLFTAPSLLPWWKIDALGIDLPFAGYTALHLSMMAKLRDAISQANIDTVWIGASYPDVINAVLNRTGFGPTCGVGNVQEPIPKIQHHVAQNLGCHPRDVQVQLVAQHAFEYYVLNDSQPDALPPYLLKTTVKGRDVSGLARDALTAPYPFPYDLHFNRVTASAGVEALRALTADQPTATHLPGIGKRLGGYPVLASRKGISLNLPPEWTAAQAEATNAASLPWDGIAEVHRDGTIHYSDTTTRALHGLLGQSFDTLTPDSAPKQARALLTAFDR
jgi:hypothetical protein